MRRPVTGQKEFCRLQSGTKSGNVPVLRAKKDGFGRLYMEALVVGVGVLQLSMSPNGNWAGSSKSKIVGNDVQKKSVKSGIFHKEMVAE